ncbi:MAG: hypothetical protein AAFY00_14410 [Bacteroidota bacterium]
MVTPLKISQQLLKLGFKAGLSSNEIEKIAEEKGLTVDKRPNSSCLVSLISFNTLALGFSRKIFGNLGRSITQKRDIFNRGIRNFSGNAHLDSLYSVARRLYKYRYRQK